MATHADIALFSVAAATLYGALIGSFLNVVIYRLPRECMSLARPGSSCPRCGAKVRWYDNAPVVSFLLLGGRCRACRGPISWRYPFVEALTAILFGAVALKYAATPLLLSPPGEPNWARAAAYCALLAALVAAAGIDMALYILPDEITLGGLCLAPLAAFCFPEIMAHLMAPAGVGGVAPLAGRMGALLHSLFGAFVGGAILALVG
ncbi:MAG: prepilin peptidase, partial [Planctomycetes bacterium]|nr:prepilin peptidase [Planctomycetota bacterium]